MNRKEFIRNGSLACLTGTLFSSLLSGCASSVYYAKHQIQSQQLVVHKKEFEQQGKDQKKTLRKYVVVKSEQFPFPICLVRISEGEYHALYMECTHRSCELNPQGTFLQCPCHGSEFNLQGQVQNPPAEKNLRTFKVTTQDETIRIHF
jgi:cytochrome b6-f complex iron-sulfur subunit